MVICRKNACGGRCQPTQLHFQTIYYATGAEKCGHSTGTPRRSTRKPRAPSPEQTLVPDVPLLHRPPSSRYTPQELRICPEMPQERHPPTKTPFRKPKPGLWSNKRIRTKDASIPISVLSTCQLRSIWAHLHRNAHQWRRAGERGPIQGLYPDGPGRPARKKWRGRSYGWRVLRPHLPQARFSL